MLDNQITIEEILAQTIATPRLLPIAMVFSENGNDELLPTTSLQFEFLEFKLSPDNWLLVVKFGIGIFITYFFVK